MVGRQLTEFNDGSKPDSREQSRNPPLLGFGSDFGMMRSFLGKPVRWSNSVFLISTLLLTLTAVPFYIWRNGVDWFQISLFGFFFVATGLSVTLGYHRL